MGFLPKNEFIVNNNTSNLYLKLDKAMLTPMSDDIYNNYSSMFSRLHLSTILKLRQDANIDKSNHST